MEKIWIVESRYINWDQDDGMDIFGRFDTYVHKTEEGARDRFEALKENLELWGFDNLDDYETYQVTDNYVALEYSYRANELIMYQSDLSD